MEKEKYNAYMADYMLRRYHKRMADAKQFFGGKCSFCGNIEGLEFDHINSSEKSFTIGKLWSLSNQKFEAELQKCQLLCENCHKEKHQSKYPCGTPQRYWRGCRCMSCTKSNSEYSKEYKKKRKGV